MWIFEKGNHINENQLLKLEIYHEKCYRTISLEKLNQCPFLLGDAYAYFYPNNI